MPSVSSLAELRDLNSLPALPKLPPESTPSIRQDATATRTRDQRYGAFSMALGLDVLTAHGVTPNSGQRVVFAHNYTSAEFCQSSGILYPPNITPDPATDFSVASLAACTTRPGEAALTLPLAPGMERYLRERGVLRDDAQLLEVNPDVALGETHRVGWPFTDVVTLANRTGSIPKSAFFVASLPTQHVNQLMTQSGAITVQRSSALDTNNKVKFQRDAATFDYRVVDGMVIEGRADLERCAARYSTASRVWVKHATAAGGDAVIPLSAPITIETLEIAAAKLLALEHQAESCTGFTRGSFEQISPAYVVQLDASTDPRDLVTPRKVHTIGGALFQVQHDGKVLIHSYHEQDTDSEGIFYGSKPFYPTPDVRRMIDEQILLIGEYCATELSLFGNLGIDLVVVEDANGELSVELIELNGRPNATTLSRIVAETIEAPFWQQVTVKTNNPINDFSDVERLFGKDALYGGKGPQFVVMGLGSLYRVAQNGERELLMGANYAKVLVIGNDPEQVKQGLERISACKEIYDSHSPENPPVS